MEHEQSNITEWKILEVTEIKQELTQDQESFYYCPDMIVKQEVEEQTSESATTNEKQINKVPVLHNDRTNEKNNDQKDIDDKPLSTEVKTPERRGEKRKIYDINDDPETIEENRKKRAVELKQRNLKCNGSNSLPEIPGRERFIQNSLGNDSIHSYITTPQGETPLQNDPGSGSIHSITTTPQGEISFQNSVGNSSLHSCIETSHAETSIPNNLANRLLQCIQDLQAQVMDVNKKIDVVNSKVEALNKKIDAALSINMQDDFPSVLPDFPSLGIKFPIDCHENLISLNSKLLDTKFQNCLIHQLHAEGTGRTPRYYVSDILKILLTTNVAASYSRLGRKGKKSFKDLKQVYKVILTVGCLKFPNSSKEEIAEVFGKALAGAGFKEVKRSRSSRNHANINGTVEHMPDVMP